ncbi:MAG TPA: NUDIX hydrolase [Clostridia bacterium]|nr:NUDIX hydrolase [Clostridia bacterium]
MLPKRDTRVQLFIMENGRYVMLEHHIKQKGLFVWGLPGGGIENGETPEETALREAFEETGLRIRLMPKQFERDFVDSPVYRRAVTFVAVPEEGTAVLGEEPEEEMKQHYALTGIRWQDLCDRDLAPLAIENTDPVLNWILSDSVPKKHNRIFANYGEGTVLADQSGQILHEASRDGFDEMIAASEIEAMLGGNLVAEKGACRLETTLVHRVEGRETGNIETGNWIKMTEAIARTANLGVARHLKKRMEE